MQVKARQALVFQIMLGVSVLIAVLFIADNTVKNLAARGIASGFDFLSRPAGFDIAFSLLPYNETSTFLDAFWVGVSNTLLVAVLSILASTVLGLLLAVMGLAENPLLRLLQRVYVETIRNVPLLLQLFFWYFVVLRELPPPRGSMQFSGFFLNNRGLFMPFPADHLAALELLLAFAIGLVLGHFLRVYASRRRLEQGVYPVWTGLSFALPLLLPAAAYLVLGHHATLVRPELTGFNFVGGLQLIPELLAMVLSLSLYTASFIGEIIRAGILALPKGQREAATALGLSSFDSLRLVILPQALKVIIPPLISQYLNVTKNSSLAAAIAFPDLVLIFAGTALNSTGQALEIMGLTLCVYLFISLALAALLNLYQRRIMRYES